MSPVCNSPHRTDDTNFEKVPLIPKPKEKLYKLKSHFERGHTKKLTYYNSESLLQWQALFQIVGVAFADWCIMRNVLILAVISLVCGVSVVLGLDRMKLDMMKFEVQYLNSARPFLKIFITFMLGIYVNRAFIRWWSIILCFQQFISDIKQLIYFFHTSNVDKDTIAIARRWAMSTAYCLDTEAKNAQQMDLEHEWYNRSTLQWLVQNEYLTPDEHEELERVILVQGMKAKGLESQQGQVSGTIGVTTTHIWSWLGDLLMNFDLKMSPPMHSRIMGISQCGLSRMGDLQHQVTIQVPYMYAHLLSFLVHLNNIIAAVTAGISLGASCSALLHNWKSPVHEAASLSRGEVMKHHRESVMAVENMAIQIMMLMVEPLLYLSFLRIGHLLCYPFGYEKHHVSLETNLAWLQAELEVMDKSFDRLRKRKLSGAASWSVALHRRNSEASSHDEHETANAPFDFATNEYVIVANDANTDPAMDI